MTVDAWPDEPEHDPDTIVYDPDLAPYETIEDGAFHISSMYGSTTAKTYRCKTCGGTQFLVCEDYYFTGIKCPVCGWERCVHSG